MKDFFLHWFYYIVGIVFLLLAKAKSLLMRYTPKTFSEVDVERCVAYDIRIVDDWLACLKRYTDGDPSVTIENRNVLELGPGSDLGIGLYLLSKSVQNYFAVDVYDLANHASPLFYASLFAFLSENRKADVTPLAAELSLAQKGADRRLHYICRKDFDIPKALTPHRIDFIFSNAAFEHFNDISKTIADVSQIASKGAFFIALVDHRTHSRWIRDKDPNNIYRYPTRLYKMLSARSTPNRIRPYQYEEALEKNGWTNIAVYPVQELGDHPYNFIKNRLNKQFRDAKNQMKYLTTWICATKT